MLGAFLHDAAPPDADPAREALGEDFLDRGVTDLDGHLVPPLHQDGVESGKNPRAGGGVKLEEKDRGGHGTKVRRSRRFVAPDSRRMDS